MTSSEKAPRLAFECPKLWQDMPGSEEKRFCEVCGHHVHNLSLMSDAARKELLQRSRSERICGIYFEDLSGNLITGKSEVELIRKKRALRLTAIASGAIALSSCSGSDDSKDQDIPLPGIICLPEDYAK